MKIGQYDVFTVETGWFALDGGSMFGVIPRAIWERQASPDAHNRITLSTRSLLIIDNRRKILVDTGNGDKWNEKQRAIYRIDTDSTNIESSLDKLDISSDDITDVLCTHLHFDHAGGNTCLDESGKVVPTFPNATYWIQRANWELANSPSEKDKASYRSENWDVLAENNMIELVEGEEEFIPGIEIIVTTGHTEGQQLPKISKGSRTIFFGGDLFPTVAHLQIPWVMAFDNFPLQTISEKKKILAQAVDEEWILVFEHDRHNEASTISYDGHDYYLKENVNFGVE